MIPDPNHWLVVPVLLPLIGAALQLLLEHYRPAAQGPVAVVLTAALGIAALHLLGEAETGAIAVYLVGNWPAPFGIVLALDRLTAIMLMLTAVIALGTLATALRGASDAPHFHTFFQVQLAGLNGAFLTADLFNLFVFFEVLLVASYALLLHGAKGRGVRAGLHYVIINLAAAMLFLVAASLIYGVTGTLNFADLAQRLARNPLGSDALAAAGVLLLMVVFGVKAAVLPLGFWLPETYLAVPPAVAALFAIMTKVGIYALLRIYTLLGDAGFGTLASSTSKLLLAGGLATIVVGAFGVFGSESLLRLVTNLVLISTGTLVSALAFGPPALPGALYYLVHSTIAVAFMLVLAHTIAAQRGGVADRLASGPPVAASLPLQLLFLGGVMAIAGLPPWSGFIGKIELLHATIAQPGWGAFWLCVLGSGLIALFCLARTGTRLFWETRGANVEAGAAGSEAAKRDASEGRATGGHAMTGEDTTSHAREPHGTTTGGQTPIPSGAIVALGWFALAAIAWAAAAGPALRYMAATGAQLAAPAAYVEAIMRHAPVPPPNAGPR